MKYLKICLCFSLILLFSCSKSTNNENKVTTEKSDDIVVDSFKTDIGGLSDTFATISTLHGNIVFRFYTKDAPKTSARVMHLIQNKFYDGLIFHRAIPNFIIQTGDPTGTGHGGSGTPITPEFNKLQHIKGTLAMARGVDKNSADSQFYIALTTLPHLDEKNTVFGQVVEGIEVLSKLSKGDKIISITLNIQK